MTEDDEKTEHTSTVIINIQIHIYYKDYYNCPDHRGVVFI